MAFLRLKMSHKWRRRAIRLLCVIPLVTALGWFALPFAVPLPDGLTENPAGSPVFLDRHGVPLARLTLPDSTRSTAVPLAEIPPDLIASTLAAEDKRFYHHGGIDLLATLRASRDLILERKVVSGASTITQQLVKISGPPARRNVATKIREALNARRLEMTWSKDRILETYLNRLDYGNLRIGVAEAARFYFGKPLADLSLAECALLSGIPQAPSRLNPMRRPEQALVRRDTVLHRLADGETLSETRLKTALGEPLMLSHTAIRQPALWLAAIADHEEVAGPIRTTLDRQLQIDLETIVREETARLKSANLRHAAVVVIDNPTGELLALVSSANWDDPRGGQFNGAMVPRSPGSTLKPFTYLLAIENLHRIPPSILADVPTPFRTPQGVDLPENYDRAYRGPVTLRAALACSLNVPALRELNQLGGPRPLFSFLQNLGITTMGDSPQVYGLGLTLGNAPVRLLELTNAYATLARQGRHLPALIFPAKPVVEKRLFDPVSAYLIADILADPVARAPSFQPGGPLDLPFRCAVKTGTSSDFHDNWCVGFTPRFTVGVWAGNFEQQPMKGLSGIAGAGPIFHRAMIRLHRDTPPEWFTRPDSLISITIDPRTGKRVSTGSAHSRDDLSPLQDFPPVATAADYDDKGRALLDPSYAEWFESRYNSRRGELALATARSLTETFRIISPATHATYLLDPEIPSGSDRLRPVTNLPGTAVWHSDTLQIEAGTPEPIIHLKPGIHIVTATDPRTGKVHTMTLEVKSL